MSCANMTGEDLIARPAPTRAWFVGRGFTKTMQTVLAFQDALREAFEMRRMAHRQRPFYDE